MENIKCWTKIIKKLKYTVTWLSCYRVARPINNCTLLSNNQSSYFLKIIITFGILLFTILLFPHSNLQLYWV